MHVNSKDLVLVQTILQKHLPNHVVWAFGSRVHGRHLKPFSDLDLVIRTKQPLDLERYCELKEAFSESDLPFKVDIVDWTSLSENFKNIVLMAHEAVQY